MVLAGEGSGWWCLAHKKREPEEFFVTNGARLLEESISYFESSGNKPIRFFSAKELQKATNNYAHPIRQGTYLTYKGIHEGRTITVNRPNPLHYVQGSQYLEDSINEVVILSHVYHQNVVKLLGCCIETEIPILVFESFFSNGTLYRHLHGANPSISWENRLKIATETAYALTYLHTSTSRPIVHRDIHSKNILLDEGYTPKIIGFGLSMLLPLGETHVETSIRWTSVYGDPIYMVSGRLTEKSDVYNFGVVLLELLTGKKAWTEDENNKPVLLTKLISGRNGTGLVLKANDLEERKRDELIECTELALRCVKRNEEERPTMKEVVQELKRIKRY